MPDEAWVTDVLRFWFDELREEQWWKSDPALDAEICARFMPLHERVVAAADHSGALTADGALATVIVLDQLPRNMFRGAARAFATDPMALSVAETAIARGLDAALSPKQRPFLYMPFMHAEDRAAQARAIALFTALGDADSLKAAHKHKAIIDRFGRYPHRNAVLGRANTAEEQAYLDGEADRFGQ